MAARRHSRKFRCSSSLATSPELNPTELLNQDVNSNALSRRRPRSPDELIGDTRSYLRATQRRPRPVARYFVAEHVRYAKAA